MTQNSEHPLEIRLLCRVVTAKEGEDEEGFVERKFVLSYIFEAGSVPEATCEPEGEALAYDAYELKKGYQLRLDIMETADSVFLSVFAEIDIRGTRATDVTDEFEIPIRMEGEIAVMPPVLKARPATRGEGTSLNKDKYNPPEGWLRLG